VTTPPEATYTPCSFAWVPEVDAALVGRRVEVVFDPFDLTRLQVRYQGRTMGTAIPHRIGEHVHPAARAADTTAEQSPATGIDYLRLVRQRHTAQLTERVRYAGLSQRGAATEPSTGTVITDHARRAELASFAELHDTLADQEHSPDHPDLTTLPGQPRRRRPRPLRRHRHRPRRRPPLPQGRPHPADRRAARRRGPRTRPHQELPHPPP
jgi:hypothetical protein